MKRPVESDYTSHVAYTRALEEYCDALEQPEQKPVAYIHETGFLVRNPGANLTAGTKLYAAPKREWVGLTDEEYTELWGMKPDLLNFFRKIEAKLKEKNHG